MTYQCTLNCGTNPIRTVETGGECDRCGAAWPTLRGPDGCSDGFPEFCGRGLLTSPHADQHQALGFQLGWPVEDDRLVRFPGEFASFIDLREPAIC